MIKNTLKTTVAAAMLICTGAAQAAVQDIAVNGGFETGAFNDGSPDASWQQFPNGGIQNIVSPGNGSTYAAELIVPVRALGDPAVDNLLKNANLAAGFLTPGAPITVTFDMRGELQGAGGVVFIEVFSEFSGGGATGEIYTGGPLFPSDPVNWTSYTWNTNLGDDVSGGVTLQLKASCGPVVGCGVNAQFDNITISTDVSAVPVPAAVWLFGSGLLGLVGVARRKKAA